MSRWRTVKAARILAAMLRIGWTLSWQAGSHRRLTRPGWGSYTFAFKDNDDIAPVLLDQIAKKTGL